MFTTMRETEKLAATLSFDVAIIGGGCSGICLCVQLSRQTRHALTIVIVDRSDRPARGVAYDTEYEDHILNVKAAKMGAVAGEPDHFTSWLSQVPGLQRTGEEFVPRRLYGEYLEDTLDRALEENPHVSLTWIKGSATSLAQRPNESRIVLENGCQIDARIVILATGNGPPAHAPELNELAETSYAKYPWAKSALEHIPINGTVLLVGSGLTAVDQVLALRARGFCGKVVMVSRRGRLPAVHLPSRPWPSDWLTALPPSVSSAVAAVRKQVRLAAAEGVDWRAVVDSLRKLTPQIWKHWPLAERKRFLRHVRPFWEVARHRLPPRTHQVLMQLVESGSLVILAGRLLQAVQSDAKVNVSILARRSNTKGYLEVDRIINCTGPGTSVRVHDPLILNLVETGHAQLDPLRIGVCTDDDGALLGPSGERASYLYAIGPVRKATLWETVAVPEIRDQAFDLAGRILAQLSISSAPGTLCENDWELNRVASSNSGAFITP